MPLKSGVLQKNRFPVGFLPLLFLMLKIRYIFPGFLPALRPQAKAPQGTISERTQAHFIGAAAAAVQAFQPNGPFSAALFFSGHTSDPSSTAAGDFTGFLGFCRSTFISRKVRTFPGSMAWT